MCLMTLWNVQFVVRMQKSHAFCIECLRKYTEAAHEEMPFARGGLGLKCMALNCKNPLSWQEIKDRLPDQLDSLQTLENQCAEFCVLSVEGLCLVRCPNCDCAIGMETSDTDNGTNSENLKFQCPECQFEMCHKCKAKWDEQHKDLTCEQFDKLKNYKDDPIDKLLSEAIIHQCVMCNIKFIKGDGCNHMKCPKCKIDQCYCCRKATGEAYKSHFCTCQVTSRSRKPLTKCPKCKKCRVSSDVRETEEKYAERMQRDFEKGKIVISNLTNNWYGTKENKEN
ncbi:hypothetical protein niasHT_033418 [Heterodera trifolii]|uniref:RING-type domain-containing protein n=1 Tax=Heterodera trifolii TaxID=157864 RepID=A0ABD2HTI7_9BILA